MNNTNAKGWAIFVIVFGSIFMIGGIILITESNVAGGIVCIVISIISLAIGIYKLRFADMDKKALRTYVIEPYSKEMLISYYMDLTDDFVKELLNGENETTEDIGYNEKRKKIEEKLRQIVQEQELKHGSSFLLKDTMRSPKAKKILSYIGTHAYGAAVYYLLEIDKIYEEFKDDEIIESILNILETQESSDHILSEEKFLSQIENNLSAIKKRAIKSEPINSLNAFIKKCGEIVNAFENTLPLGAISCKEIIIKDIKESMPNSVTEYETRQVYTLLLNVTYRHLSSGAYHIHAGTLNPLGPARALQIVHEGCAKWLLDNKFITQEELDEHNKALRENIASVG